MLQNSPLNEEQHDAPIDDTPPHRFDGSTLEPRRLNATRLKHLNRGARDVQHQRNRIAMHIRVSQDLVEPHAQTRGRATREARGHSKKPSRRARAQPRTFTPPGTAAKSATGTRTRVARVRALSGAMKILVHRDWWHPPANHPEGSFFFEQFTDMKSNANIKTRKEEGLKSRMRKHDGKIEASRKGSIANTFAKNLW